MGKDYRLDTRTKEQFAADIKAATATEQELMTLYVKWLNTTKGGGKSTYSFVDNGVDNTGGYLNSKEIVADADFKLFINNEFSKTIEVKYSINYSPQIHIKINQLLVYQKNKSDIVIFMDLKTNKRSFTYIMHKDIDNILKNGYKCKMWNKECVRLYTKQLTWQKI